jgi:hypothetical protein
MRRYRIDASGQEQPVWASESKIADLGAQEGRAAAAEGRQPIRWGNTTYDDAARKAFEAAGGILTT